MAKKQSARGLVFLIVIFLAAVAGTFVLPFLGARNMVRGYERTPMATFFLTIGMNALLIVTGLFLGAYTLPILRQQEGVAAAPDFGVSSGAVALSVLIGLLIGLGQRGRRLEELSVDRDNMDFMRRVGLRATGGEDVTHYDVANNPLRFIETRGNQQIFMAVGRRNKRAYIDVDSTGRMTAYSGIVSL